MRETLLFCTTLFVGAAAAQCDFTPVISPGQVVLCADESQLLTVGAFDTYQWYKDGQPIVGANGSEYLATNDDSATLISVEVTLDGCTEMSPAVPVDGLLFVYPWVIGGGDDPIGTGPNDEFLMCEGDVLEFHMGEPYTENIQWTRNGVPIPGATGIMLEVTETGVYHVSGAPDICPNFIQGLGVALHVIFFDPQQPTIVPSGDELCATPLGLSYTWYLNGEELDWTEACITADGAGAYTVFVEYGQDCEIISEPYLITSINERYADAPSMIYPNPSNGNINIAMDAELSGGAFYTVFDAAGRVVFTGRMPGSSLQQLDLQDLEGGTYMFRVVSNGHALAPASRFTIVK